MRTAQVVTTIAPITSAGPARAARVVVASTVFAAISGSSVATAATIGTVAFPTFRRQNYAESWVAGSVASGATLGILIPPSINLIIYGAITNTSIGALFLAGILPGVVLALAFMGVIIVASLVNPAVAGRPERMAPWPERRRRLGDRRDRLWLWRRSGRGSPQRRGLGPRPIFAATAHCLDWMSTSENGSQRLARNATQSQHW